MYLYQVSYHLLVSATLTGICFPNKILVSGITIIYSSVTTQFLYSKSLPYQLLLSAITVLILHNSCSGYSLQVLFSAIFISYSFLLLSATLISYSYQRVVTTCVRVLAIPYCISSCIYEPATSAVIYPLPLPCD